MIYGPSANWGVDAPGLQLAYTTVDQYGSFPGSVFALGGYYGTQPVAVSACAARQTLISFSWCASFASYFSVLNLEYVQKRYYSGTFWALSTAYRNEWGSYWIVVAGNGTTLVNTTLITPNPAPPAPPLSDNRTSAVFGTWNLNNFQTQSPDFLYDPSTTPEGVRLDRQGIQIIVNDDANEVSQRATPIAPLSRSYCSSYACTVCCSFGCCLSGVRCDPVGFPRSRLPYLDLSRVRGV
jgi:hypothetical protein